MPYSPEHKSRTRQNILQSARYLFSTNGFNEVTVNQVMEDCSLTRGAFYAHFKSKADLYQQALKFSASKSELAKTKPDDLSNKQWVEKLLDIYLSEEHINGIRPCPLAFLATDIASRDSETKHTYQQAYQSMNHIINQYMGITSQNGKSSVLSLTSMIIGGVAIARTMENQDSAKSILYSCRQQAQQILDNF